MKSLDLVILGDMHYVGPGGSPRTNPVLHFKFGLELGVRAVRNALLHGRPDAIILLGDIVDRGSAPGAMDDLRAVHAQLSDFGIPVLAVPGNHDEFPDQVQKIFGGDREIHEVGDYRFVMFADRYAADTEVPSRPPAQMALLQQLAGSDKPIIALQHPLILPDVGGTFPYNFPEAGPIARAYEKAGVCLSISGHYHAGLPAHVVGGVTYLVCPALSEAPFVYTRLHMNGTRIESLERVALSLGYVPGLHDMHMHTEFAYCAKDITIEGILERLDLIGIPRAGILEHADQLYAPRDGFWERTDANDTRVQRQCRTDGQDRHKAFRRRINSIRSPRIRFGLEIEPAADGRGLAVLDEDRHGYDYLVGAVHHLNGLEKMGQSQKKLEFAFLAATRQLLTSGVDILAHPFRFFPKKCQLPEPRDLYPPLLEMLVETGTAAEINFHAQVPDPEFFAQCIRRGIKISLGSDSHSLVQVGDLHPHLELIKQIGAIGRLDEILWPPPPHSNSSCGLEPPAALCRR